MSTVDPVIFSLRTAVDRSSPVPYYAQVSEAIQKTIEHGYWKPGDQLPGEPELCEIFNVSRTVIRQALQEMELMGLIIRKKGVGTFVAEPKIEEGLVQKLTGFYQDMAERGYAVVTRVLCQEVIPASQKVAKRLQIPQNTNVIIMERLRFVAGEPIVLVTTYLPYDMCPGAATADFSDKSLYEFLKQHYSLVIERGKRTLEVVLANEREAELLEIDQGAPLMMLDSVSFLENGMPIEYYHAVHRGDRSRFEVDLVRKIEGSPMKAVTKA